MNTINQFFCGHDGDALEISNLSSGMTNPAQWFYDWATGGGTFGTGVPVNGYTALTHCPIWQGVNIIAGDIGQTPVRLVRNRFEELPNHPAAKLLQLRPNGLQTPSTYLETMVQWALMWGQGVSWIQRQGSRPFRLVPLRPDCLWKELIEFEGNEVLLYHYYSPLRNGTQYVFFPWEVIDIPGLTADGVCGYELHRIARNTIGHGLALEKHGNAMFTNGAVPGGVLEAPAGAAISKNAEARKHLRDEWNAVHKGPDKAGAIAILWEGIQYKAMSHTNVDAQWLEARKDSRYDAASLLNLPPHKLGAMEDSSVRANLEEQNADYAQRTLSRWYNRMSEEFRRKLLTESEWMSGQYEFIWDVNKFLKADIDTMTTVADRMVKATIWNPNEARAYIGYAPRAGGEVYGSPAINPNQKGPEDGKESPDNGRPSNKIEQIVAEANADSPNISLSRRHGKEPSQELKLRQRISRTLERERSSLMSAAASVKNFVSWLDEFYGSDGVAGNIVLIFNECLKTTTRFHPTQKRIRNIRKRFCEWAGHRKETILDLCSSATATTLVDELWRYNEIYTINEFCDDLLKSDFDGEGNNGAEDQ